MIESIGAIVTFAIWAFLIYLGVKMFAPKKCPKCGHIAFGFDPFRNTNSMDRTFVCMKCKHTWYIDYTNKWWKIIFKKK
jgi:hypothetical protein